MKEIKKKKIMKKKHQNEETRYRSCKHFET